jgi:uncharacterized protein YbaR (Trm112 family)
MFITKCPKCGTEGSLHVISGKFECARMPLTKYGFDFGKSRQMDTYDETVWCEECHEAFPLSEVME